MDTVKTKIKLCGMRSEADLAAANALMPEYIGFILCPRFWRYVQPEQVRKWKRQLAPGIQAVGVFVDQEPEEIAALLNDGTIELAQLHGSEDENYIAQLRRLTDRPMIKAFKIASEQDLLRAEESTADYILLDSGTGTGTAFDWTLLRSISRPWFLAGGLNPENAAEATGKYAPWAVDVSSGIETDKQKDPVKMAAFVRNVRQASSH